VWSCGLDWGCSSFLGWVRAQFVLRRGFFDFR
jgi:hypothetical protein